MVRPRMPSTDMIGGSDTVPLWANEVSAATARIGSRGAIDRCWTRTQSRRAFSRNRHPSRQRVILNGHSCARFQRHPSGRKGAG